MQGRASSILLSLVLCGFLSLGRPARAQSEAAVDGPSAASPALSVIAEPGDVIYEKGADGKWRAVPVTEESLESFGGALKPTGEGEALVPDYFVSGVQLDGEASSDWANLTAEIEIGVMADGRWLRVPLRLDQALLLGYEHEGAGDAAPVTADQALDEGLTWLLRGKGTHRLKLSLRVPLRRTANGSQLQLAIPRMAKMFAGELTLVLPGDNLLELGEGVQQMRPPKQIDGQTRLQATLSGERVDVRWHPLVEESAPISRTLTHMTLRLRNERMQLAARQEVRLRQSGLPFLDVRMPSQGFRRTVPVRVSDLSGAERQVQPIPAEHEGWVRVPLEGVVGTGLRLDWTFESPFDEKTQQLIVDGLEVAGADDQSGTIAIEGFDRHLLTRQPNFDEGVLRIGVDELPAAGAFANLAYRFQTGSYRLVLDVDPIESAFRVTPIYLLEISEFRAQLVAQFVVSVDAGQVDGLSVEWPQMTEQGWRVDPAAVGGGEVRRDDARETNGGAVSPAASGGPQKVAGVTTAPRWLLKSSKPLGDGSRIGLSAERTISASKGPEPLKISFPQPVDARMLPAVLVVAKADNIEATVEPAGGTLLSRRAVEADLPPAIREGLGDLSRTIFQLMRSDAEETPAVEVTWKLQPRTIHTRTTVAVRQIDSDPRIAQTIDFDVSYGRLSALRFRVPPSLLEQLPQRFRAASLPFSLDGQMLEATWFGSDVELTLPGAKRGAFQILVGPYTTPQLQASGEQRIVPILTSIDRSYESVRLAVPDAETVAVRVEDERWTAVPTVVDGAAWVTNTSTPQVALQIGHDLAAVPQRTVIATAVMRSRLDASGAVLTQAEYQLNPQLSQIVVRLPDEAQSPRFGWNLRELDSRHLSEAGDVAGQYLIERPEETQGESENRSWLTISYVLGRRPLGWTQATSIGFPRFGKNVTIERTFWELVLPRTQHLLTSGGLLSPAYEWSRDGFLWRRSPLPGSAARWEALVAAGAAQPLGPGEGNVYPFETLGTLEAVGVSSMSTSFLVFVGAGLSLVTGFLVLKVPLAKSAWLWLLLGTIVAVLALWQLEAVLLLLQPAAYGLVLPLCAAVFERVTDRRAFRPETLSTRHNVDVGSASADGSDDGSGSDYRASVPSTLVRPAALSDSGAR